MDNEYPLRQDSRMSSFFKGLEMENTPIYVLGFVFGLLGMSTLIMNHFVAQKVKVKVKKKMSDKK